MFSCLFVCLFVCLCFIYLCGGVRPNLISVCVVIIRLHLSFSWSHFRNELNVCLDVYLWDFVLVSFRYCCWSSSWSLSGIVVGVRPSLFSVLLSEFVLISFWYFCRNMFWSRCNIMWYSFSVTRQFCGFLRVFRFPSPIKLVSTIYLKYCWKWR